MRALLAALILLFSASAGQAQDPERDILWQMRPPDWINRLGIASGMGPGVGGLAWWGRGPCIVMTPPPPLPDAAHLKIRAWLRLINHELRHCREKRNFHQGE